jgi:hypothetical protein
VAAAGRRELDVRKLAEQAARSVLGAGHRVRGDPLTTTGVPLAVRDDWREVLRAAADTGTLNI